MELGDYLSYNTTPYSAPDAAEVIRIGNKKMKEELHVECPYCKKAVVVREFEEIVEKAVPAEKNTWTEVEKDLQSKLTT